jgi:hypothetical protein
MKDKTFDPDEQDEEEPGFARSEKAAQASQLNLSARLSKDGTPGGTFIIILWLSIVTSRICIARARIASSSRDNYVPRIWAECLSVGLY